jgi:transposase InsO family protein
MDLQLKGKRALVTGSTAGIGFAIAREVRPLAPPATNQRAAAQPQFIRISGMTHVRTSPYYPQSNGKIERWHKSLNGECIRPGTPLWLDDARRPVQGYVEHYNMNNTETSDKAATVAE